MKLCDERGLANLADGSDLLRCVESGAWGEIEAEVTLAVAKGGNRPNANAEELIAAIRNLELHLDRGEGDKVARIFEKGQLFSDLKGATKPKAWASSLEELGIDPRVASRLMRVGSWARRTGLEETDLRRLPGDVLNLERIAALDRGQLDRLLGLIYCRKASRTAVIRAVKQVLGQDETTSEGDEDDRAMEAIERLLGRLIVAIEGLGAAATKGLRARLRDDVIAAFGETLTE